MLPVTYPGIPSAAKSGMQRQCLRIITRFDIRCIATYVKASYNTQTLSTERTSGNKKGDNPGKLTRLGFTGD